MRNRAQASREYTAARARYLVRPRHPQTLDLICGTTAPGCGAQWHDHAGDQIWSDFGVNHLDGAVTERVAYNAGVGFEEAGGSNMPNYFHADQIGTTRVTTDSTTAASGRAVFTAFGEPVCGVFSECGTGVSPVSSRYRYAGAWGYEAGEDRLIDNGSFDLLPWEDPLQALGWLHVGHRYYAPELGRFLQRDPIGIRGGLNVYAYCGSAPTFRIDPLGNDWIDILGPVTGDEAVHRYMMTTVPKPPCANSGGGSGPSSSSSSDHEGGDGATSTLGKLKLLEGAPSMIEGALIADVVCTTFIYPMRWIGLIDDPYRIGDMTRTVAGGLHGELRR